MNKYDKKYTKYALCNEMMQAIGIIRNYDIGLAKPFANAVLQTHNVLLTGEGSSRIFPAKHFRNQL
jgi:glucosamine--fructose-6-phosphate aminotransferase (isomerizing)